MNPEVHKNRLRKEVLDIESSCKKKLYKLYYLIVSFILPLGIFIGYTDNGFLYAYKIAATIVIFSVLVIIINKETKLIFSAINRVAGYKRELELNTEYGQEHTRRS